MQPRDREKGFTVMELLVFVAMVALAAGISLPMFASAMQRAQTRGAGGVLAAAIRDARMRAVSTGWQYQVVAYGPTGAVPNSFRIEGMNPLGGGTFPPAGSASTPPFYGNNQTYEAYTVLPRDYGTAQIQVPGGGTFTVTFDSLGQWATPCAPANCQVQVSTTAGVSTLTVSQAGAVRVVKP